MLACLAPSPTLLLLQAGACLALTSLRAQHPLVGCGAGRAALRGVARARAPLVAPRRGGPGVWGVAPASHGRVGLVGLPGIAPIAGSPGQAPVLQLLLEGVGMVQVAVLVALPGPGRRLPVQAAHHTIEAPKPCAGLPGMAAA